MNIQGSFARRASAGRPLQAVRVAVCAAALFAAGCSLFRSAPVAPPPPVKALPPPEPQLPKPVAMHKSEVLPDSDVVGEVQRTVVGKDDTLPDIARRFDVGYEE